MVSFDFCKKKYTAKITVIGPNGFGHAECYLCGRRHMHTGTEANRKKHHVYCVLSGVNRGLEVKCPVCRAKVGQPCRNLRADWVPLPNHHPARREAAEVLPVPDDFLLRLRAAFRLRASPPANYMLNEHWKGQGKVRLKP